MSTKIRRLLKLFEDDLYVRFSETTVRGYLSHLRCFLEWLDEKGLELSSITTNDLLAHQSELLAKRKENGKPYSSGHHQNRLSALKCFFRFLVRRSFLLNNPAAAIEMPRGEKRIPRSILSPAEAKRLLEVARERTPRALRDRAILETLYGTGIRISELTALTLEHVDTEQRSLTVVLGKGRKGRMVPLTAPAARAIEAWLTRGRPQFPQRAEFLFLSNKGLRLQGARVNEMIRDYAKKARIRKHTTCHTLRHSVATHLLRGRADIRHIQALLGHRSLQTTERYTRVEISDLQKVLRRAHPRGR